MQIEIYADGVYTGSPLQIVKQLRSYFYGSSASEDTDQLIDNIVSSYNQLLSSYPKIVITGQTPEERAESFVYGMIFSGWARRLDTPPVVVETPEWRPAD